MRRVLSSMVVVVAGLVVLGWWLGTPYLDVGPDVSGRPELKDGKLAASDKWSCSYVGLQGRRDVVRVDHCPMVTVLAWESGKAADIPSGTKAAPPPCPPPADSASSGPPHFDGPIPFGPEGPIACATPSKK